MLSPKGRIQIVEDEFIIAEDLKGALHDIGHTVVGMAETYQEAVEHFSAHDPDLVLLDINLGGKEDGIGLGRILSEKNIPFIYISAYIDVKTREKAEATGPVAFLIKPFDLAQLEVNIKFALGRITMLPKQKNRRSDHSSMGQRSKGTDRSNR